MMFLFISHTFFYMLSRSQSKWAASYLEARIGVGKVLRSNSFWNPRYGDNSFIISIVKENGVITSIAEFQLTSR